MSLGHLLLVGTTGLRARPARTRPLDRLVRLWGQLFMERRALSEMDPRLLNDIGLSQGAAAREAARPFWDVPTRR